MIKDLKYINITQLKISTTAKKLIYNVKLLLHLRMKLSSNRWTSDPGKSGNNNFIEFLNLFNK